MPHTFFVQVVVDTQDPARARTEMERLTAGLALDPWTVRVDAQGPNPWEPDGSLRWAPDDLKAKGRTTVDA